MPSGYYAAKDVPHGQVSQRWYYSKVTGKWRRCYVYTPPDYEAKAAPVIPCCTCCTAGERTRQGWHTQGHADLILDNLIAEKKAKPMIIVMDNLNTVKPGEDAKIFSARGISPPPPGGSAPAGGGGRRCRGRSGGSRGATGMALHRDDAH